MAALKITAPTLVKENSASFEAVILSIDPAATIDTWSGRAELRLSRPDLQHAVLAAIRTAGFVIELATPSSNNCQTIAISGMTCHSCEVILEHRLAQVPGVSSAKLDAQAGTATLQFAAGAQPDTAAINQAIEDGTQYKVGSPINYAGSAVGVRPSLKQLVGALAIVLLIGYLLSKFQLGATLAAVTGTVSFLSAIVLGLVAGTSSCVAVSGGLLLSSVGKIAEKFSATTNHSARLKPVLAFVVGRTLSYGLFGVMIGALGTAFTLSPLATGVIILVAAVYMVVMGLDMLRIAPALTGRLMPRLPKSISKFFLRFEGRGGLLAPFALGASTFFLPCGYTQMLQLYALASGSAVAGGSVLLGFAIGTAPALLAIGWASTSVKGKWGELFFRLAGTAAVVLGLLNLKNGLVVSGFNLSLGHLFRQNNAVAAILPPIKDGRQQITMSVGSGGAAYTPDHLVVAAGKAVDWTIQGVDVGGCISQLVSRPLGINQSIALGENHISFIAPSQPGDYPFSCSMGMYKGTITVVKPS